MSLGRRTAVWPLLVAALACASCGGDSSSSPAAPSSTTVSTPTPTTPLPPLSTMLSEKTFGSPTAPVTMIEYSSLTCSHCGDFHVVTFPLLKSTYVDAGRVKYVFRDFPLNEAAIVGAMVARCSGDRFFTTLNALYANQYSWAFSTDYKSALKTVVAPLGITSNDVDACLASTELRNGILAMRSDATATYGVNATPTFVINGQKTVGALSFAQFSAIIDGF
jgi:protein-disulfide isomerase